MFPDPMSGAIDAAAATYVTFVRIYSSERATKYRNSSATAGVPRLLEIEHTTVGKGAQQRQRHLVRLTTYAVVEGVEDLAQPSIAYAVFDIRLGLPESQSDQLFTHLSGFLRGNTGSATPGLQNSPRRWLAGEG